MTSSGNMPPVCSNSTRRNCPSATSKRRAIPGRCQTGSIAAFVTRTSPLSCRIVPSGTRRPAATASFNSGMLIRALVTAIDGRRSTPAASSAAKAVATMWPHGSSDTILSRIRPLRVRADHLRRRGIREIGPMVAVEPSGGDRECAVERVSARVRADRVALRRIGEARHDRPALGRGRGTPFERRRLTRRAPERVGGQYDVARHAKAFSSPAS